MSSMGVHYSSKNNEWDTPQDFFDALDQVYDFTLDPCCAPWSAKCDKHYTAEDDGLSKSWEGETVFMNPPYGREIGKWIAKAYAETRNDRTTVVCLIPSRTDTKYWHDYVMKADAVYFVKGRLKFGNKVIADYTGKTDKSPAPFPSAVIVFGGHKESIGDFTKVFAISNTGV